MAIISMQSLMQHALEHKYAVGYFESWNLESLLAVKDAAERTESPVIIGFNGTFLGNGSRLVEENVRHYGALAHAVAENATVPAAVLLNEADRLPILYRALSCGFNAVMYADPAAAFEEAVEANRALVPVAHACGAAVEAEVGELPTADVATGGMTAGELTDPDRAAWFARETGVDALAVAVGNVHLLEGEKAGLDFDLIERLRRKIDIPLVLHGGTGLPDDGIRRAIALGMCKVNVGTAMKRTFINSIREYLGANDVVSTNPHEVVGMGGDRDMLCGAREAIACKVAEMMKVFGCAGMAGMR